MQGCHGACEVRLQLYGVEAWATNNAIIAANGGATTRASHNHIAAANSQTHNAVSMDARVRCLQVAARSLPTGAWSPCRCSRQPSTFKRNFQRWQPAAAAPLWRKQALHGCMAAGCVTAAGCCQGCPACTVHTLWFHTLQCGTHHCGSATGMCQQQPRPSPAPILQGKMRHASALLSAC